MKKPFPITIDVEEEKVGHVLRQLDTMAGILTIHLRINKAQHDAKLLQKQMKPVQSLSPPGGQMPLPLRVRGQKSPNGSMRDIIIRTLANGAVHKNLIGQVLAKNGLSAASANSVLHNMLKEKLLVRVGPGTFRLSNNKTAHARLRKPGSGRYGDNTKGLRALVLSVLSEQYRSQKELMSHILEHGYSRKNMYNMVPRMRGEGLIEKNGEVYNITDRGRAAMAPDLSTEGQMLIEHKHGEMN